MCVYVYIFIGTMKNSAWTHFELLSVVTLRNGIQEIRKKNLLWIFALLEFVQQAYVAIITFKFSKDVISPIYLIC